MASLASGFMSQVSKEIAASQSSKPQSSSSSNSGKSSSQVNNNTAQSNSKKSLASNLFGTALQSEFNKGATNGKEQIFSGYKNNTEAASDFNTRFTNYWNSGKRNVNDTRNFRLEAQKNAATAINAKDKAGWLEVVKMLDDSTLYEYWNQINSYDRMIKRYETNLTNAQNAARSAGDVLRFWDDPEGLYQDDYSAAKSKADTAQSRVNSLQKSYNTSVAEKAKLEDELRSYFMTREVYDAKQRLSDPNRDQIYFNSDFKYTYQQDQKLLDDWNNGIGLPEQYYNAGDRMDAAMRSAATGIGSGILGAFSMGAKATLASGENQARTEYEKIYGKGSYDKMMAEHQASMPSYEEAAAQSNKLHNEINRLNTKLENLYKSTNGDVTAPDESQQYLIDEIIRTTKRLEKEVKQYDDVIKAYNGEKPSLKFRLDYGDGSGTLAEIDKLVDSWDEASQKELAKAKTGTGKLGAFLLDAEKTTLEIGFDTAIGALTGGSTLVPMFFRVLGNESAAARREGADESQQLLYGTAKALIEVATEKMFGIEGFGYGKGYTGELSEKLVHYLAQSPLGKTVMRTLIEMGEEGAEEVVSTLLSPLAKKIYSDESLRNLAAEEYASLAYDFLLGAVMGGMGAVGNVATGQDAYMNYQQYQGDIARDIQSAKEQGAADRSAYNEAEKYGTQEDVERVISEAANRPDTRSLVTQILSKNKAGQTITTKEAAILRAAGIKIKANISNSGVKPGLNDREAAHVADNRTINKTAGKEGYIQRYTGSDTDILSREQSPERGEGEQLAEEGDLVLETTNGEKIVVKKQGPSESSVKATQSAPESGDIDTAPKAPKKVKQSNAPATEEQKKAPDYKAIADVTSSDLAELDNPVVDNSENPVHNVSITSDDVQKAVNTGIGELQDLYVKDPDGFAAAYKELTGEDFDQMDAGSELREFYRKSLMGSKPAPEPVAEEPATQPEASAEPELAKPASEEAEAPAPEASKAEETAPEKPKTEEKPKPEKKLKAEKKPKESKPPKQTKQEKAKASLDERGVTADNIYTKIREGNASAEDIKNAISTGFISEDAAKAAIEAVAKTGRASTLDGYLNAYIKQVRGTKPTAELSESEQKKLNRIVDQAKRTEDKNKAITEFRAEVREANAQELAEDTQSADAEDRISAITAKLDRIDEAGEGKLSPTEKAVYDLLLDEETTVDEVVSALSGNGTLAKNAALENGISIDFAVNELRTAFKAVTGIESKLETEEELRQEIRYALAAYQALDLEEVKEGRSKNGQVSTVRESPVSDDGRGVSEDLPVLDTGTGRKGTSDAQGLLGQEERQSGMGSGQGLGHGRTLYVPYGEGGTGVRLHSTEANGGASETTSTVIAYSMETADAVINAQQKAGLISEDKAKASKTKWTHTVEDAELNNNRRVPEKKFTPGWKAFLELCRRHNVPMLTLFNAKMQESADGWNGFTPAEFWNLGLFMKTSRLETQKTNRRNGMYQRDGTLGAHEISHIFGSLFALKNNGKRPSYYGGVAEIFKKAEASGFDKSSVNAAYVILKVQQMRKTGCKYLGREYRSKQQYDAKVKQMLSIMSQKGTSDWFRQNLKPQNFSELQKEYAEEMMVELASNSERYRTWTQADPALFDFLVSESQVWLETNGGVPAGFYQDNAPIFEMMNKENEAWLDEQEKKAEAKEEKKAKKKAPKTEALDTGNDLMSADNDFTPEAEEMPEIPSYMRQVSDEETSPKQTRSREKTMAPFKYSGEKSELGGEMHEVQNEAEINKLARDWANKALASKKEFDKSVKWLKYREGGLTKEEMYMAEYLFSDVDDALSAMVHNRQPRNKTLRQYSFEELSEIDQTLNKAVPRTKTPAAQILRGRADIPDTQKVRINARESFFKNLERGEIDPNNVDTKLERIVEDYTYHIEKLDADGKQDVQKMLKLTKDIAYTRNTSSVFGLASKTAQNIENFVLDYIAKHDPNAYDTLRSFALGSANRISSDFQTVGAAGTLAQVRYLNMLSNFATAVSNVGNNYLSIFNETNAQNVGKMLLGKYFENKTGEEQIGWDYSNQISKENLDAMALGAAKGLMSLYYGLEVDNTTNGKADYDIGAKFNQNTKILGSNAFGKFLARMTMLSGIKMQVTDAAAKARTMQGMKKGVDEMNVSDERKAFMYTDNKQNADYRLFHEDTPINQAIGKIRKELDRKLRIGNDDIGYLGLGTLMMPFVKVPINVATHALRATPVGSFVGMAQVGRGMIKANRMHSKVVANQIAAEEINDPAKWKKAEKELDHNTMRILKKLRGTDAAPNTFAKAVRLAGFEDAVEMSQQESANIIRKAGRVMTNTGLTLLGALAAGMGAIKNFDDEEDDDMKRLAKEHGLTGLQFNLSAILEGRQNEWDFDNDLIIGGSWLEIASIPFIAGAELWQDAVDAGEGKKLEGALKAAAFSPVTSLVNVAEILKDMPGLEQLSNIYDAIENTTRYNSGNFKDKVVDSVTQYAANQAASFVIPNSFAQVSAGLDNTVRDVYNTDSPLKTAANIIVNKTPFRNRIPERIMSTGETRRYDDTTLRAVINKAILPGDFHRVTYSDLEKEWAMMSKAGATNVMPPASAPKKVTLNGDDYVLDASERQEWLKITNTETAELQSMLSGSPYWNDLSPDMKKKAFQDARKTSEHDATFITKGDEADLVKDEYYDRWELNQNGKTGIAEFLPTKYYVKSMYDKEGNVTNYSALDSFIQNGYDSLTDETKVLLENSFHDLDSMDEAWDGAKITAKEYYDAKAIYKEVANKEGYKNAADIVNMHVDFDKLFNGNRTKADWAEDNFVIFNQTPGDTRTKDKIISNGYSLDLAQQYVNLNTGTEKMPGYDEVQDHQKFNNVVKMKFSSEDERWDFFFDNVMPAGNTKQIRNLNKCRAAGDDLATALNEVKDSSGNPLSAVYGKDEDGNKYIIK